MPAFVPYCGLPPIPGSQALNLDPHLLCTLAAGALAYEFLARRTGLDPKSRNLFRAGWIVLSLAFISPLCNISVALFSARVSQHMLLTLVAAPLIAFGIRRCLPACFRWDSILAASTASFAFIMWLWHSPGPYDETLRNNFVYWAMHLSTLIVALLFWSGIASCSRVSSFVAITLTGLQMSLLGAILSFAHEPLFSVHSLTTLPWGLTQMQDQQLGGLVMWIPAGLLLTAFSIFSLAGALRRMDLVSSCNGRVPDIRV